MTQFENKSRITVSYVGRVQGVGFRYTVCRIAEPFDVTGYVKNLADGSVELVAEGEQQTLSQLHDGICQEMTGNITKHALCESPATGEFKTFDVAY
ncbi:MAG: acylphosphatase [Phycisphaerae bacterium]|nr:MAG: acylphosphatase [Phycisphaerae bacterium]